MRLLRNLLFGLSIVALINATKAFTQSASPGPRILERVDENQLVTLKGNVHPSANSRNDMGPVRPDLAMTDIVLVLSRGPEQQAAFDEFVAGQYDASSPNFHHWLQPAEVGERFGPSLADIGTISNWLASRGLSVAAVSKDRMSIRCGGTAAQVEGAFHTEIHNLSVNGEKHFANMSDPQIPAALAPVVAGIKGLHNFFPHPLHRMGSRVQFSPEVHGWVKVQNAPSASLAAGRVGSQSFSAAAKPVSSPTPDFYFPISGTTAVEEDVAPYDFAAIYNLPSGWPTSNNGSGQTIAIIGTSDIDLTDVSTFKSAFGLPAGSAPVIAHGPDGDPGICTGSTTACSGGDLDENSLDVEWSGAVAPGAQIVLVTDAYNSQTTPTNDPIYDGAQWVVDNADVQGTAVYGARIVSISYGQCELFNGTASNVAYNNLWQTAASAGIAVFVATGDAGSAGCDQGGDAAGYPYEAQYGAAVSGLSSTPYNTAVGGTEFSWCKPSYTSAGTFQGCLSSNATAYWNTSNTAQQASAKGYVAETPWNDSCLNPIWTAYFQSVAPLSLFNYPVPPNAEAVCDFIYNDWAAINQKEETATSQKDQLVFAPWVDTVGGAGGASGCVVSSTTSSTLGSCSSSDTTTGSPYNLTLVNDGWPKPSWQTNALIPGLPADGVRDLPDVSFFAGDGALESATLICVSNDGASCTNISATASGATGEAEEVGGTSVATPQMAGVMALINQKAGVQGNPNAELYALAARQIYSGCSAESVLSTSTSCYFNDIDQGTNAMPCDYQGKASEGGAVYSGGSWETTTPSAGLASPNCSIVNSGDVVGTLAGYGAITGYDQATGLGSLNIANVVNAWTASTGTGTATVTVTPTPPAITVNQSLSVAVTLSVGSGTPTGTVTLVGPGYDGGSQAVASPYTFTFTIPAYGLSGGTDTLVASYSGDANFAAASATATVTVSKLTPTGITVTPSATSIAANVALTVTGTVSVPASDPTPSGTVTLTSGGYTSAATELSGGGAYSIAIPASSLSVGSDTLTVTYSGDGNYLPGTPGTGTVTVTAPAAPASYALSASAPAAVSPPDTSASSTVTVTASNGYAGTVTLTCALTSSPTGASDLPTCAPGGASLTLSSTLTTGTATVTVTTTAATSGALVRPDLRRNRMTLASLGAAAFALLALLGIPAQRRWWRAMLGALVLLAALGSLSACGGGGGSGGSSGGGTTNPGTTAGTYTFTVTGTGNPAVTPAPTTTFTVTVN
jgi:hypothetical protein